MTGEERLRDVLTHIRDHLDVLVEHFEEDVLPPRMVAASGMMFPFLWTGYTGMQIVQSLHAAIALLMVGLIIAFPKLVSSGLGKEPTVDVDKAFQQMQTAPRQSTGGDPAPAPGSGASGAQPAAPDSQGKSDDDAMKSLLEGFKRDADKKP